jgi:hypothetical protein
MVAMSETSEASATRPVMSDHVKTIFKQLFDEQTAINQQQWKITNYAVLLIAAAFTLSAHYGVNPRMVVAVVWIAFFVGAGLLLRLQWDLGRYRNRIDRVHKAYFNETELIAIDVTPSERASLGTRSTCEQAARGLEFTLALIGVVFGGALLVSVASH